jgi:signal transduction histidine kinase
MHRWHLSRASPMRDTGGTITMWISSNTDIDDQKRIEGDLSRLYMEAESLNRAKDDFLATISHELRTPITSILGWAELLTRVNLDETTRRDGIATILRSARSQAKLIDDVLDVTRMITGKLLLTIEPIDLESLLRSALTALLPAANAKNIEINLNFQADLPPLLGDTVRLHQVFWNLLFNSLKFTPAGGRIDIRLVCISSRTAVVEVQDTGMGISPEFLPFVFDRFAQEDVSLRRNHGGMGIGLSIVKQLVELHGGTVSAASDGDGRGATFTVSLPMAAVAVAERLPIAPKQVEPVPRAAGIGAERPAMIPRGVSMSRRTRERLLWLSRRANSGGLHRCIETMTLGQLEDSRRPLLFSVLPRMLRRDGSTPGRLQRAFGYSDHGRDRAPVMMVSSERWSRARLQHRASSPLDGRGGGSREMGRRHACVSRVAIDNVL